MVEASRVQSSSRMVPLRMCCSWMPASAESRRMVISVRLISSEKMTAAILCLIAADRTMSSPMVELCVGIMALPARYRWSSASTSMHRTGTEPTRSTRSIFHSANVIPDTPKPGTRSTVTT